LGEGWEKVVLDEDEQKIVNHVENNGKITTKEAVELIEKVKRTANRKLSSLQEKGVLERKAETETDPTAFYQFPNQF
jgi:DeoR/GlpR family transcriptional regulator of sugar metabolism